MYIKYPVKHALRNNMFQLWHCSVSMVIANRSSAACVRLDFCLTQKKKRANLFLPVLHIT